MLVESRVQLTCWQAGLGQRVTSAPLCSGLLSVPLHKRRSFEGRGLTAVYRCLAGVVKHALQFLVHLF